MSSDLMLQVGEQASRPNPWPLYAQLRQDRVVRLEPGSYAVGRYDDVLALLEACPQAVVLVTSRVALTKPPGLLCFLELRPGRWVGGKTQWMRSFVAKCAPQDDTLSWCCSSTRIHDLTWAPTGRSAFPGQGDHRE